MIVSEGYIIEDNYDGMMVNCGSYWRVSYLVTKWFIMIDGDEEAGE